MLRVASSARSQPVVSNLSLVTKRWQKAPAAIPTKPVTTSTSKMQTTTARATFNESTDRMNNTSKTASTPSSSSVKTTSSDFSRSSSSGGGGNGMAKVVIYGIALGLTATIAYAEYENGPFRRQLESTVPLSSTILDGLDQVIDPVFGRLKKSTKDTPSAYPDLAYVKEKPLTTDPIKPLDEPVKVAPKKVQETMPVKVQIADVKEKSKETLTPINDKVTDPKKVKAVVNQTADQVFACCTVTRLF
jgi:Tfp pilus assembly major pilin PilA